MLARCCVHVCCCCCCCWAQQQQQQHITLACRPLHSDSPCVTPIHNVPATQSSNVSETGIDDLSPLQALGATLMELVFEACSYVEDLGPLSGRGPLARLNCSSCADVADMSPLAALHSSLTWLSLSG